jgi:MFS family permease
LIATLGYVIALHSSLPAAWFIGARLIWGIGSALVFATSYTIAADVSSGGSRGSNMGIVRGGITLGFPAGLVLGGIVSDQYSISIAFLVAAGLAFVASLIAYATVPETHVSEHQTAVPPWDLDMSLVTLTIGFVNFGVLFAYLGALFSTLVLFVDAYGISVWGYGPQGTSGLLMAVTVVTASGLTFGGGKVSDLRGSRTPVLFGFLVVSFAGFALLAVANSLSGLVVACALIGGGQGGTSGPLLALLGDLIPDERMGRAMGTTNIFGDIGAGLGPVVTLPLIDTVGFTPIYAACALIPLIAGAVLVGGVYAQTGTLCPEIEATVAD